MSAITPELIRAALAHIPSTLQRDEWARVGMANHIQIDDVYVSQFTHGKSLCRLVACVQC